MKIYLDGCDGSGKSTLADYLCKKFKIDKFCLTKDSEKSLYRYFDITDIDDVVCDRTFISEIVYPPVFGRKRWLSNTSIEHLIERYKDCGLIIICTAPTEVIKKRITERGEEFKEVLENLENINSEYIRIAKKYDILLIDTNEMSYEEIYNEIERKLKNG